MKIKERFEKHKMSNCKAKQQFGQAWQVEWNGLWTVDCKSSSLDINGK